MYEYDEYDYFVTEYSIEDVRKDLNRVVEFFKNIELHDYAMEQFLEVYRKLPKEVGYQADAFYVDEDITEHSLPDWMHSEPLGFIKGKYIPMKGRLVFPVKDVMGDVMGLCGWDPFIEPKYLDSKNYGYKAKATTLYGMEKLPEYYKSKDPVFLTEGLMCTLYLRSKGFQALAALGSYLTPYVTVILNRFGNRLVTVPDNDETGDKFAKQIRYKSPKAMIVQCKYGKDIENLRKIEEFKYEEQLLKELRMLNNPFVKTDILIRR